MKKRSNGRCHYNHFESSYQEENYDCSYDIEYNICVFRGTLVDLV